MQIELLEIDDKISVCFVDANLIKHNCMYQTLANNMPSVVSGFYVV